MARNSLVALFFKCRRPDDVIVSSSIGAALSPTASIRHRVFDMMQWARSGPLLITFGQPQQFSSMLSVHTSTHSSQMNTAGPAISLLTCGLRAPVRVSTRRANHFGLPEIVSSPSRKNNSVYQKLELHYIPAIPSHSEGHCARSPVRDGDAVDADGALDPSA